MTVLRLATRKSALALAQSRQVARTLQDLVSGLRVEEMQVVTQGDRVLDRALSEVGGKGLFVREIEEALLDGRADLAVHSMKDLPAQMAAGLVLAAVPRRESPWDALVTPGGVGLDALLGAAEAAQAASAISARSAGSKITRRSARLNALWSPGAAMMQAGLGTTSAIAPPSVMAQGRPRARASAAAMP